MFRAVARCTRGAASGTAALGAGATLQLAFALYMVGGRSSAVAAVAWSGDALLCTCLSAMAWYLGAVIVRVFGGQAGLFVGAGTIWMVILCALWLPTVLPLLCGTSVTAGMHTAPGLSRLCKEWQGPVQVTLAVLPAIAVLCSMRLHD